MNCKITETCSLPAILVAFLIVVCYGVINLAQLSAQRELFPLNRFFYMMDYRDYYQASAKLGLKNSSPYSINRYVTPPAAAILNYPLSRLNFNKAKKTVSVLILLSVLLVVFLSSNVFIKPSLADLNYVIVILSILICFLFSYPFYFLFERGNIDWLVLLFFWCGVYIYYKKHFLVSGLFLGISICLKVYPILCIAPIIIHKKWNVLLGIFIMFIILFITAPSLWIEYFSSVFLYRSSIFRVDENISLANTLFYFTRIAGINIKTEDIIISSYILYFVILIFFCSMFLINKKRYDFFSCLIMIVPLMIMVPATVYAYEGILLLSTLPFYCFLYANNCKNKATAVVYLFIFAGLALSQFQAILLEKIFMSRIFHFIPGLGLFTILCANIALLCLPQVYGKKSCGS